jgi:hypothetical protein
LEAPLGPPRMGTMRKITKKVAKTILAGRWASLKNSLK